MIHTDSSASSEQADRTGGELIIQTLKLQGVTHVFGYSGGAALPLFDAMSTVGNGMQLVATRHEQGASHMADGYARAGGAPGVTIVTSGPGATNTFTGIMTAQMDSIPTITITGQVPTHAIGTDAFQEARTTEMTRYITKSSQRIENGEQLIEATQNLFNTAISGRPGPVLMDVPKDISAAKIASPASNKTVPSREITEKSSFTASPLDQTLDAITRVATAWRKAKRPLILAGHGVLIADASALLTEIALKENTPVTTTLLGKGVFPETNSLSLGMLGMHGTAYANFAVMDADFVLAIGCRFDDRIIGDPKVFLKDAFVAHIDIDTKELGKTIQPTVSIQADAKQALQLLLAELEHTPPKARASWVKKIQTLKETYPLEYDDHALTMQQVIEAVWQKTKGNAIVSTDVGQHQMWAAQFWKTIRPNTWLSSGGAGTMGFGFPAAIGAQFAKPNETVIAFVGDGGFQMTLSELSTAVRYKLPIKIFVLDNNYLGMVRQWQELFYDNRESGVDMVDNPDFVALAKAYGAEGILIDSSKTLYTGIEQALDTTDCPTLIHVKVNRTDNVYPFIPAGAPYTAMLTKAPDTKLESPKGSS